MRNNSFAAGLTEKSTKSYLSALADAGDLPFDRQIKAAGLNPAVELQHSDLAGIELSFADLRGFNFTGASLSGATGIQILYDHTTIFKDADLQGSALSLPLRQRKFCASDPSAEEELQRLRNMDQNQAVLWVADELAGKNRHRALSIAQQLFVTSEDDFIRSQTLFFLSPSLSDIYLKELLLSSLSTQSLSGPAVRTVFNTIRRRGLIREFSIRQTVLALLHSGNAAVREASLSLLITTGVQPGDIDRVKQAVNIHPHLGAVYVTEITSKLGEEFKLIVRHTVTGDTFHIGQPIQNIDLYLIARKWLKLEANTQDAGKGIPLSERTPATASFTEIEVRARMGQVVSRLKALRKFGISFLLDANAAQAAIPNLPIEYKEDRTPRRPVAAKPGPFVFSYR